MVTKLNYKTQLHNMVTKLYCITSLHNNVIKQSYVKQLCNVVTQRRDETLYRAAVLALYQAKVRRFGRLFRFTRLKRRSARAPGSPGASPHHARPGPIYGRGSWSWS